MGEESPLILRANGCSMLWAGIHDGDMLIADRDSPAEDSCLVVARIGREIELRKLTRRKSQAFRFSGEGREMDVTSREHVFSVGVVRRNK